MEVLIEYGENDNLEPEIIDEIKKITLKYGRYNEKKWGHRAGAIDLLTILEIVGLFLFMKTVDGFVEGLVGKNWFTNMGEKTKKLVASKFKKMSDYLVELYEKVISNHKNRYGAICLIEHINDVTLYVVLNHKRMNNELITALPVAISEVVRIITTIGLPEDNLKTIQLYPNFETNSWDYIFIPTNEAFGRYIDRYFNLQDEQFHNVGSLDEFKARFLPDDEEDFKLLITCNRNGDSSRLDNL